MTAFEELKREGTSAARLTLSCRKDESQLVALIHSWLAETDDVYKGNRSKIAEHPATAKLAEEFAAAGLAEAADHLRRFGEETGPIHPGLWLFAILLGKACAKAFVAGLHSRQWQPAMLWGHDCFGAWEAYRDEIVRLLLVDEEARNAAWAFAEGLVEEASADPAKHIFLSGDRTSGIVKALSDYSVQPAIKESWETQLDAYVHFDQAFFLKLLGEIDRPRCLQTLGRLPHPVFVEQALGVERPIANTEAFVSAAPVAFDAAGAFRHQGMVVVISLRAAAAHIRRRGWEGGEAPVLYPASQPASLEAAAQQAETAIASVLDAVFARPDAEPLAWAWLERLIFEVEHRGYWRVDRQQGNGTALDIARLLIVHVASRLGDRADWQAWVLGNETLWQIDRLTAVLAVGLWGKTKAAGFPTDAINWALKECVIAFPGADSTIARSDGIVGYVGAACVLASDNPGSYLRSLWQGTRAVRERAWRNAERNQIATLIALWGLCAMEWGDAQARANLEPVVEDLLRDAFQTETEARLSAFWPRALHRFGKALRLPEGLDNTDAARRLADFLRPFARPDSLFLDLSILLAKKWGPEAVRSALASMEIDLAKAAQEFLEIENRRIRLNGYDKKWLEKIRDLAAAAG